MMKKFFLSARSLYKSYPALYSTIELSFFLGLFFFNMWLAPFWFWGIYRLNIQFPHHIEIFFFYLWHMSPYLALPSVVVGLSLLVLTFSVRKDPLKELGIRFDNLKASAKECLIVFLMGLGLIILVFLVHIKDFMPKGFEQYFFILSYPLWAIAQQFALQSIMFVRLLQIIKNKNLAISAAAVIFSLLHIPNIPLMVLTLFAGGCCCVLFSRHRNIFSLGILHGVMAVIVHSLLVPGVIPNYETGPIPTQWKTNTQFIAQLRYEGSTIVAKRAAIISIPIEVENISTALWDSTEKQHPVHISYHLMDAEGNMIAFDNIRSSFPNPLEPGQSVKIHLTIAVPSDPGRYLLEIDVVKEMVSWFKDKGSLTVHIPLVVATNGEIQPSGTIFKQK